MCSVIFFLKYSLTFNSIQNLNDLLSVFPADAPKIIIEWILLRPNRLNRLNSNYSKTILFYLCGIRLQGEGTGTKCH